MPQTDQQKAIWASIGDKKKRVSYVEAIVKKSLVKDEKGRDVIRAKSGRLDFTEDFIFKGVTPSGNVKTERITQEAFRGEPEERETKIGKVHFDTSNENVKLILDNHSFFKTLDNKIPNQPPREKHPALIEHEKKLAEAKRRFENPTYDDHYDENTPASERSSEALALLDDQIQRSLNIHGLDQLRNNRNLKEKYVQKLKEAKIPLSRVSEKEIRHLGENGHTALSLYLDEKTGTHMNKFANFENLGDLSEDEKEKLKEQKEKEE